MDIHRSRFIPYPSSAINALAFSATHDHELSKGGLRNLRLAVGRANGDIEIWNPLKGAWQQERVFHGGRDRTVEGVLWIQEPSEFDGSSVSTTGQLRLFSIGYSNAVTEWDLATGLPLRQSSGNLSEVWCFAAQPRLHVTEARKAAGAGKPCGQDIVVGCADGSVALLTTADNDLHFQKYIARPHSSSARALSIAFRDRNIVAVGYTNSSFRIYDIRSATVVRTVTLGAGSKGGPRNLHVWALRWLPNGDIVTADSAGEVRFFDSKLFGQYQRIKAHQGDILSIAVSQDGGRLFTAGIDRSTSVFARASNGRQWVKSRHHFYHEHDVKALAVYDGNKTQQMSFLASGGLDTNLSIIPVRQHGQEYHRGISGLPQQQPVTSSSSARLVASWQGQEVTIWRIRGRSSESSEGRLHRLLARVSIKGDEAIADAALSQSGRLLAVSTVSETRVFELSTTNDPGDSLSIQKVEIETPLPGGYSVQISSDQKWLSLLTPSNNILVYRLGENEVGTQISKQPFRLDRIKRGADSTSLQSYRRTISRQQFSPGSKVLVVADLSGFIDCWKLEGEEDTSAPDVDMQEADDAASESSSSSDDDDEEVEFRSYGQYWRRMDSSKTLPQLDSAALVLSFRPERKIKQIEQNGVKGKSVNGVHGNNLDDATEEDDVEGADSIERPNESYELVVLTASHRLYEFDLVAGKFTDWSRRNTSDRLPTAFQKLKDRAMGCYWHNTADAQRLYFYGSSWLFMFDVLQDFEADVESDASDKENRLLERPRKRKWEGESGAGDRIRDEDYVGFRPSLQTTTQNGEPVKKKKKKVEQEQQPQSSSAKEEVHDDDEEEEEEDQIIPGGSLRLTRVPEAGSDKDVDGGVGGKRPRRTWHSFAYRPILAVVPLQQTADYIETVLVERPLWELDLPPRLAGPHDKAG